MYNQFIAAAVSSPLEASPDPLDSLVLWSKVVMFLWIVLHSLILSLFIWVVVAIYNLKTDKDATLGDAFCRDAALIFIPFIGPLLAMFCGVYVSIEKLREKFAPALRSNPFHPRVDEKYKDI